MLFDNKNNEIVLEAYYGSSNNLINASKNLSAFINEMKSVGLDDGPKLRNTSIRSKYLKAAQKNLEDEFECKISLIVNNSGIVDAHTNITATILDTIEANKKFNQGKPLKGTNTFTIYVSISRGIITNIGLTGSELLAIILHEIGHNISRIPAIVSLNPLSFVFNPVNSAIMANVEKLYSHISTLVYPSKIYRLATNAGTELYKWLSRGSTIMNVLSFPAVFISLAQATVLKGIGYFTRYFFERAADSFVVAHGYGPELARAIDKLQKFIGGNNNSTKSGAYLDAIIEVQSSLFGIFLDHPQYQERIKNAMNKLEREINDGNYPNEVKQQMRAEYKEIEKLYKEYMEAKDDETKVAGFKRYIRKMKDEGTLNTNIIRSNRFTEKIIRDHIEV